MTVRVSVIHGPRVYPGGGVQTNRNKQTNQTKPNKPIDYSETKILKKLTHSVFLFVVLQHTIRVLTTSLDQYRFKAQPAFITRAAIALGHVVNKCNTHKGNNLPATFITEESYASKEIKKNRPRTDVIGSFVAARPPAVTSIGHAPDTAAVVG